MFHSNKHDMFGMPINVKIPELCPGEYTMPVRCPNHRFRAASAGRTCDHRADLRASWPLRFCLTLHNEKFEEKKS